MAAYLPSDETLWSSDFLEDEGFVFLNDQRVTWAQAIGIGKILLGDKFSEFSVLLSSRWQRSRGTGTETIL